MFVRSMDDDFIERFSGDAVAAKLQFITYI